MYSICAHNTTPTVPFVAHITYVQHIFLPQAACCFVACFKAPPLSALPPWLYLHFSVYPDVTEPRLWLVALSQSLPPQDYYHWGESTTRG